MYNVPFESEEEELAEIAELAYWEQNKALDEEENQTYEEWIQGEMSYWGYNNK